MIVELIVMYWLAFGGFLAGCGYVINHRDYDGKNSKLLILFMFIFGPITYPPFELCKRLNERIKKRKKK